MTTKVPRPKRSMRVQMATSSAEAAAALEKQGLTLPAQPTDPIPSVPESVSELGDGPLMELFAALTAWAGFLSGQLAVAEIDERAAESALDELEALALIRSHREEKDEREARLAEEAAVEEDKPPRRRAAPPAPGMTVLKAHRDLDPAVVEQKQEIANRYAYRKLIGVLFTNVERDAALVSRELTRRTGSYESKPRRESRWRA